MVIDSSAFLAILLGEPEASAFRMALGADATRLTSSASVLETAMVMLSRFGEPGAAELQAFLRVADVQSASFGPEHLGIAIEAFRRFGKGRHPAALNFGDCFSYALAKTAGEPLLFKGDDFSRTDIERVV